MGAQLVTHGALDHAELAAHGLRPDELLDFSSNLNPFGPPPSVRAALAALDPAPYPDRSCVLLRQALAARHGCDIAQVLCGNGSNELIHLVARVLLQPSDTSLVVAPTFGEYAHASQLAAAQVQEWRTSARAQFVFDCAALASQIQRQRPRLTWLCAPNNPTGINVPLADIHAIAAACAAHDGWLVLDRTYHAFVRERAARDDWTSAPPNVLHVHSLTKSYALAGLRIGYVLGNADVLACITVFQPTWSVSSAAQAAGLAALDDADFLPRTLPQLWEASDMLRHGLQQLGLPVWRAALPFLLVRTGDGATTRAALLQRGCVVRDCASFGLPEWVRVAPRAFEENARLLAAFAEVQRCRGAEVQR